MNAPTAAEPLTTDELSLKEWVDRFSGHVANLRYDDAAAMMDPAVNSFSSWTDVVVGVEHFVNGQWRNVWPTMTDFVLLTDKMRCRTSPDRLMATVMVTWTSTGYAEDGTPFDRPGRCSFVLLRDSLDGPVAGRAGPFLADEGRPPAVLRLPLVLVLKHNALPRGVHCLSAPVLRSERLAGRRRTSCAPP